MPYHGFSLSYPPFFSLHTLQKPGPANFNSTSTLFLPRSAPQPAVRRLVNFFLTCGRCSFLVNPPPFSRDFPPRFPGITARAAIVLLTRVAAGRVLQKPFRSSTTS